ncbi:MAG: ribonuclease Z [Planctomycetes bacterium]|nr:ribonuclease Z [Planctomycetota bacterium]
MNPNVPRPVEWIVLGSGTALPTATRGSPGHLLRMGDGRGVLVDPGPGSVRAAAKQGVLLASLRAVIVTHFHPDHCLDLFALLFGLRHPSLAHCQLTVVGPRGVALLLERGRAAFGKWATIDPKRLEVIELEPGPFTIELESQRLEGVALRMPHLDHSLGYRIRGHARTIAYSGDTGIGEAPIELGRGADVYVLEAALTEGSDTARHLTPSAAARIATAAGVKELVLTHFYPDTERSDVRAVAREHFLGALVLGYDGLRLPL